MEYVIFLKIDIFDDPFGLSFISLFFTRKVQSFNIMTVMFDRFVVVFILIDSSVVRMSHVNKPSSSSVLSSTDLECFI